MFFKFTVATALAALPAIHGAQPLSLQRQERPEKATPINEAAVTEGAASNVYVAEHEAKWREASQRGALKGSSKKLNNFPPGKGVTVAKEGSPCSQDDEGQLGVCVSGETCTCREKGLCMYERNDLTWSRSRCQYGGYPHKCVNTNHCHRKWCGRNSICRKWCFCHNAEEESFKLMKEVGGFKGREDNSYNGEGGHKEEEGNSKPLEEDGGFEGGEPVEEDGEEMATK